MYQGSRRGLSGALWDMEGIESSIQIAAANVTESPAAAGEILLGSSQTRGDLVDIGAAFEKDSIQIEPSTPHRHKPNRPPRNVLVRSGPKEEKFSCPYRKRNPLRFNVRDHHNCANNSYKDIATLKRHIRTCHRRPQFPHTCIRCHKGFGSSYELLEHMRAPPEQICRVVERPPLLDPEDGIMDEVDTMLAERKNDTKVSSWKELWQKLFPSDQAIPPPDFVPPRVVEISEVARAVQGINFEEMLLPLNTTGASSNVQDVHQYLPPQFVPQFIMNLTTELENISADSYMTDQFVGFNPGQLQSDLTLDTYGSSIGGPSSAWGLNYPLNMPSTHSNIETSPAPKRTRFSCDSCNMSFNTTNDLRRHIQAKHPEAADPQYTCQCAYTSTRKDNYNRHIASCKRKRVLDPHCKCGFEASSLTELGEHVKVCKFGYGRARRDRSSTSDPRPAAAEED